jgi:putative ATPase
VAARPPSRATSAYHATVPTRRPGPPRQVPGHRPEALFRPPPERQPLAARMRPRALDEFVGQERLVGERGPLRRSVARGHLASLLLWGPPGTGKTSLARLLSEAVGAEFRTLSAVMAGVADLRATIAEAQERLALTGRRTVLFVDEIHRFNKAQQDALLPHVEDGTVTLIGATTENPYFEVNSALLSRLRVWRLEALTDEDVATIVRRALDDAERGLAGALGPAGGVILDGEAFDHLVDLAGGDARQALNVLEGAVALAEDADARDQAGAIAPTLEHVEAAAQQRVLAYDRAGDGHYDTVSAFIKSLRGNDPDAALYWLAAMVAAGEDPRFIARRLIISASEDVGNADPRALQVAVSAAQALDHVGLPEAQYALAQAATYIATAPKSNRSGLAYWAAASDVVERGSLPVPLHLRNAADRRMRHHGIGVGYRYPHDYAGHDVGQAYLPDELADRRYYRPSDQGYERTIGERMAGREAARAEAAARGRTPRNPVPGPGVDPMRVAGRIVRAREAGRRRLVETDRRDAGDGEPSPEGRVPGEDRGGG